MAMSSCLGLCSSVVLLLLVQLCFASPVNRSSFPVNDIFNVDVEKFGAHVQNCSKNCSSVPVNDVICKCFTLSKSNYGCDFPGYFTEALNLLPPFFHKNHISTRSRNLFKYFISLNQTDRHLDFCTFNVNTDEHILSPRLLYEKLQDLKQEQNSMFLMQRS